MENTVASKKKVVVVGETLPEHQCRYQEILKEHAHVVFAYTLDDSIKHTKDADIVAARTNLNLLFSTLVKLRFKGHVIPISNGRLAHMLLPGNKEIQVVCSHSAPGMIAQILKCVRDGIPSPFPTLPVVMSARSVSVAK